MARAIKSTDAIKLPETNAIRHRFTSSTGHGKQKNNHGRRMKLSFTSMAVSASFPFTDKLALTTVMTKNSGSRSDWMFSGGGTMAL